MDCNTCVYCDYCADVGAQKENCLHYTPVCESCWIEVPNAAE